MFRIQEAHRNPQDLLNPTNHRSTQWNSFDPDDTRRGVSVCQTIDDLIEYFAQAGGWVEDCTLLELEGDPTGDEDHDAHLGALLIAPTGIVSAGPVPQDIIDRIDERQDEIWL